MQLADILKSFVNQNTISVSGSENTASSNAQMIQQFIQALTPGQVISGELTDISGDLLKLLISQNGNQVAISAKLEQSMALPLGKNILFQVKNNGSTLFLSPLYENMGMEKTAALALEQANIPVTEATLALTGTLMREGMPIDKDSLSQMYQQVTQHGGQQLLNIVDLHKLQLPVNPENLEQLGNYKNMTHQLIGGLEQFHTELLQTLDFLSAEGKNDVAGGLLKAVLNALPQSEEGTVLIREEGTLVPKEGEITSLLAKSGSSRELVGNLLKLQNGGTELPMKELLSDERFTVALKDYLKQEFMVSPEETTGEKIKELYSKLGKQLQAVSETLDKSSLLESSFGKTVTQMNQNVNFLNQINQMYAYIQLPLKMAGSEAHGELYVYSNKKRLSSEEGEVSALLHLDMDHLGPVDVYVAMQHEKVSTQFYLKDEELLDFINDNIHILTERLKSRGYDTTITASVRNSGEQQENSCMKELLKTNSNIPMLSTDSFDVRA